MAWARPKHLESNFFGATATARQWKGHQNLLFIRFKVLRENATESLINRWKRYTYRSDRSAYDRNLDKQRQQTWKRRNEGTGEERRSSRTLVSSMTAQIMPVRSIALRRLSRVSWWYSWEPCEKLNRATHMPARSRRVHISTEREAGPRVQTILVLGRRHHISSGPSAPAIAAGDGSEMTESEGEPPARAVLANAGMFD
jgi:hypothetical protein